MRCGGSPVCAEPSVPAAAWHTDTPPAGEAPAQPAELHQLRQSSSCRRVCRAEPARSAACAGGKRGTSPSSAGPLRLIQKLPREAMRLLPRSSSSPARPPCTARLCRAISPCGAGLCRCFCLCPSRRVLRAAGGSGIPAGRSRLWSRSGSAPAAVTRLSPRVPAPGAPADAAGSGDARGGIAARSPPAFIPLGSSLRRGQGGLCSPEALAVPCGGCRQQPQHSTRLLQLLFKACLAPSSSSGGSLPPPTLGASGGTGFLPQFPSPRTLPLSARV